MNAILSLLFSVVMFFLSPVIQVASKANALFASALLMLFSFATRVFAQLPTGVPTEVDSAVDDAYLYIGAVGSVVLGVLAVITLIKWLRAVL